MAKNEKEYVIIQSKVNIKVVPGLYYEDVTNADAHVPDRLKISAVWPKMSILIKEGVGTYPSYITEWPTVKALTNEKIITIGMYTDSADNEEVIAKQKLDLEIKEAEEKMKTKIVSSTVKKSASLSEIAGE